MHNNQASGEVINIGNSREISIIDLAAMIWKMINPQEEPLYDFISYNQFSGKYEDVMRRVPDPSKAERLLGFKPKIELEEGLPLTIEWQKTISTCS